jgi:hypothetical protein
LATKEEQAMPEDGVSIPVPLRGRGDRRQAERFGAAMPVRVDGAPGTTEDLSASGLCFLSERAFEAGVRIEVVIEYLLDGHHYPLRCQAEVVRSETAGSRYRVGAKLIPRPEIAAVPGSGAASARPSSGTPRPRLRRVD